MPLTDYENTFVAIHARSAAAAELILVDGEHARSLADAPRIMDRSGAFQHRLAGGRPHSVDHRHTQHPRIDRARRDSTHSAAPAATEIHSATDSVTADTRAMIFLFHASHLTKRWSERRTAA